jgi:type I restriction enzyme S subunit
MHSVSAENDFKETEIGPIPVDWEVVSLSQAAEHKKVTLNPQSHPAEMFDYYSIPAYQVSYKPALERGCEIRSQKLVVESGMVLFGKLNPRVPKIWPVTSTSTRRKIASTEFIPLVPIDGRTTSEFLYYLAWSDYVLPKSRELVSGSTPSRQRVDVGAFLRIPIPLPPLPEQRRIAHVLSTIQRAIAAQDDLIAAARELKRSLMQRLFTYGPGVEPAPTKETEIGEMPEHWEVVRLRDVAEKPQYGYTQSANEEPVGPKFLRITDITERGVNWAVVPYCECDQDKLEKYRLERDDILFARTGATTGKSYIIKDCPEAVFASYLIRVKVQDEVLPNYVYGYFNSTGYWRQITRSKSGSAQAGVNATRLSNLLIPIALADEQQQIARLLSTVDRKIEAEEQRKAALEALFKSMLQQLMTGQVRV